MKNKIILLYLLLLTVFTFSLSSCGSDDGYDTDESVYNSGSDNSGDGGYGDGNPSQNVVRMTVDNDGAQAYFVTSITGSEQPTSLNENNSTWTLTEGTRYELTIVNSGVHPFQIRNSSNNKLLSQNSTGTFEDDSDVNFVDDGQKFNFTVTSTLAAEISTYFCGIHTSINGNININ